MGNSVCEEEPPGGGGAGDDGASSVGGFLTQGGVPLFGRALREAQGVEGKRPGDGEVRRPLSSSINEQSSGELS